MLREYVVRGQQIELFGADITLRRAFNHKLILYCQGSNAATLDLMNICFIKSLVLCLLC